MPRPRGSRPAAIDCGSPLASNMLEQGAEIVSIGERLGQASIASSEPYAKVSNQKVKQVYVKTIRQVLQQSKV